jgi:hypothetical protein
MHTMEDVNAEIARLHGGRRYGPSEIREVESRMEHAIEAIQAILPRNKFLPGSRNPAYALS